MFLQSLLFIGNTFIEMPLLSKYWLYIENTENGMEIYFMSIFRGYYKNINTPILE